MFSKKKRRHNNEVNAGSMADIAFLLLIFFLVTTTIEMDKGIRVLLPPWTDEPIAQPIPDKNVFSVKVNAGNNLLVEGELMKIEELKSMAKDFILNPNQDANKPDKPTKAVVSLQNDRGTDFDTYIEVYNELKAAYNELWEERSTAQFGLSYADLPKVNQRTIRQQIPLVISEAEPTDYVN